MDELKHNIINILYTVKCMIETHFAQREAGQFGGDGGALEHAESVLKQAYDQASCALSITRRLSILADSGSSEGRPLSRVRVREIWIETRRALRADGVLRGGIELIDKIPEHFPEVVCERRALKEIFYNLAKNALQAMASGGKLVIRAEIAFSTKEEPFALVTVADTGPGIPQDQITRLFEPFYTTKGIREGTGLGLYVVKALAAKNHGRVTVSTFEGFGSAFTVELPIAESGKVAPTAAS